MRMRKCEQGEVMLEGMIIVVLTTFLLLWILGVGFLYYQRSILVSTTNDAASKIAATYNNPSSDIIMGYISSDNISERDLYRGFENGSLRDANEAKADAYVKYVMNRRNFVGTVKDVNVSLQMVPESAVRRHVQLTAVCTFNTPFGAALEMFGMDKEVKYSVTSCADCTDIIDYISTVDYANRVLSGADLNSKIINCINSLVKLYNRTYAKT